MDGAVIAVSRSATHTFTKSNQESIRLIVALGVEGDAHMDVQNDIVGLSPLNYIVSWLRLFVETVCSTNKTVHLKEIAKLSN